MASADEHLQEIWNQFTKRKTAETFLRYLTEFISVHKKCVGENFSALHEGHTIEGPHLFNLPDDLLTNVQCFLKACSASCNPTPSEAIVRNAQLAVVLLIILCRNLDNIPFVSSCDLVSHTVIVASAVVQQLLSRNPTETSNSDVGRHILSYLHTTLYFFEAMYDPFFSWRAICSRSAHSKTHSQPVGSHLHVEVIPFIYDCFYKHPDRLPSSLQVHLIHAFGAIISGAQHNALSAVSPATLDILYKVLSCEGVCEDAKSNALRCILYSVHTLNSCSPDQRQVEVSTLLDGFIHTIISMCTSDKGTTQAKDAIKMIETVKEMMLSRDGLSVAKIFHDMSHDQKLLNMLQNLNVDKNTVQKIACSIIHLFSAFLTRSPKSKKHFEDRIGFSRLCETLKNCGQPTKELLSALLQMATNHYDKSSTTSLQLPELAVHLVEWLPDISNVELQEWFSEKLMKACSSDPLSLIHCSHVHMLRCILHVMELHSTMATKTVASLIKLLEKLGTHSISPHELKQLFMLLRPDEQGKQFPYTTPLMHMLSCISKKDGWVGATHFFSFHDPPDGIFVQGIRKWPGSGFSFHAWLNLSLIPLDEAAGGPKKRRMLYSVLNSNGSGFEAFFTSKHYLVIGISTKKEYYAVSLKDYPLDDGNWHCIDVCHSPPRIPFSQSILTVYIDGRQKFSGQLKFPTLSEPFTTCIIGAGGQRLQTSGRRHSDATDAASLDGSTLGLGSSTFNQLSSFLDKDRFLSLAPHLTLPYPLRGTPQQEADPNIHICAAGTQDVVWGMPMQLQGIMGVVCLFSEALLPSQVKSLYTSGPGTLTLLRSDDYLEYSDLANKLVFHYDAKASAGCVCIDLSPYHMYDASLVGSVCISTDVKDVVNAIGGIQVLYPLLENSGKPCSPLPEGFPLLSPQNANQNPVDLTEEWVVLPYNSYSEWRIQQNQAAGFLLMLLHFMQGHPENQEQLVSKGGIPIVGMLLQKVPASLIDVNLLMATQLLIEGAAGCVYSDRLLQAIYQHILFDFRIWSKGTFPVRIGHIQYMSTVIKDDRKYFRKKYGPQFHLDIIQIFYSNCDLLSNDDMKTIRVSLLGLVKYFMIRDVNYQEVSAVIGFLVTVKEEEMVAEVLDMLLLLMENPQAKDQLFLLLYEPSCADLLYCLLLNHDFSTRLKCKVLKVISSLLKTEKVYERSKARLRLSDIGFSCLTTLLPVKHVSPEMISLLMDQVLLTDTASGYQGALSLLHFMRNMDLEIKLESARKFLRSLELKPNSVCLVAKQIGWQECILGLLIQEPITRSTVPLTPAPSLDLIDLSAETENSDTVSEQSATTNTSQSSNETESGKTDLSSSFKRSTFRRLSQRSLARLSFDEGTPKTPQFLMQLKDHIFDFDLPNLIGRSRPSSQTSSAEDLSVSQGNDSSQSDKLSVKSLQLTPKSFEYETGLSPQSDERPKLAKIHSESLDSREELLCNIVAEIVFCVMWKGIESSSKQAWAERGQVFSCINMLALNNRLYQSHIVIKRTILEKTLQACLLDLQEAGQANAMHTENAIELMRFVYDFVVLEISQDDRRLSEKLIDRVLGILDVLLVFEEISGEEGWAEMAEMGLGLLLTCAGSKNLELCAMATAKLHALVQTRPFASLEEACHLLAVMDAVLSQTVETGDQEHYSFLIPVLRALLEKVGPRLHIQRHLSSLPLTESGPSFFEDFQQYAIGQEWKHFVEKMVKPHQQKYLSAHVNERREAMNQFWNQCYEATMVAMHKRNRETGESKLRFQSQIVESFQLRVAEEQGRFQSVITNMRNQKLLIRQRWRMLKLYLHGPNGPWKSRVPIHQYWKLSQHENLSRMRLKLILNHNFDNHSHASRLRDNQGLSQHRPSMSSLPPIAREAIKVEQMQEDSLGEEDLQAMTASEIEGPDVAGKEKVIISEDCELVTFMSVVKGRFELTTLHLYFLDLSPIKEEGERHDFRCNLSQLREVHLRRYNLRRSALEFFLTDQTNFFLNFTTKTRNKIYSRVIGLRPPNLMYSYGTCSPAEVLKASGLTQKWVHREISNFEYLMHLNTIAGRTYNDLSQYPVFPWILADYSSSSLDLDNPVVYRDLSKPVGVVNPKNIPEVKAKYENFVDITGTVEKFHYGTHYSNSAGVLHYLVRMEPFTSLHIELQSGRFDVADRQFHSIEGTWRMLMENPYDVKELIPEFFYLPEFLVNMNGFDLGRQQGTKEKVDDVKLPPWAESASDFIYKHRKALESEYVSAHLHEWIDLIFGYKQKGPAAAEALNVFYYVSYEGAVDLDAIHDPQERAATEGMINNFGQTPCQLMKEPHPRRMSFEEAMLRMAKSDTKPASIFHFLQNLKVHYVDINAESSPVVFIAVPKSPARSFIPYNLLDVLVTMCQNGVLGIHGWLPYDRARATPNHFTFEKDPYLANQRTTRRIMGPFQPGLEVTSKLFVVTLDAKYLISGGHWDNSLRAYSLSKNKLVAHVIKHLDVVTCLALDSLGCHLISGSRDCTCMIWDIGMQSGSSSVIPGKPLQVLFGHDEEVTCVAMAIELDTAVSGSKGGTILVHTVRDGHFLRSLCPPPHLGGASVRVSHMVLSDMGHICVHYVRNRIQGGGRGEPVEDELKMDHHSIDVYSINAKHLSHRPVPSVVNGLLVHGDYLVAGSTDGSLIIYETFNLRIVTTLSIDSPILSIVLTPGCSHLLASLEDGRIVVVGISRVPEPK